jgi:23S rRNA pseudouridine955/2504/2580 synthase
MDDQETVRQGVRHLEVGADQASRRLDNFLASQLGKLPKSVVYRLIRTGQVRVNGGRAKADTRLVAGDLVRVPPLRPVAEEESPAVSPSRREAFERSILHEDARVIVVNKPSGLAVHAGSGIRLGLVDIARAVRPDVPRVDLVHRLDRETSGCLLLAKDARTLRELNAGLAAHRFRKCYTALLAGRLERRRIRVDAPMDVEHRRDSERHAIIDEAGVDAVTTFSVMSRHAHWTLVQAEPATGRTHQIRVHARHLGHPLAGDDRYGDHAANEAARTLGLRRLFLHAARLEFELGGQRMVVRAGLPEDLTQVLARLQPTMEQQEADQDESADTR